MNENQKALEILGIAINMEIKNYNLYIYMSDKIEDKKTRFLCKNFAQDEEIHRRMLEDRYNHLSEGKNFEPSSEVEIDKISNVAYMNRRELLTIALKMERNGIEFYQTKSKTITDPKSKEILGDLVEFEKEHEEKILAILEEK